MITCPQCGNQNVDGAAFCDECGASLTGVAPVSAPPAHAPAPAAPAGGVICPQCGASNLPGTAFCDNCGASLTAAPPPPSPPPVTPPPQPAPPAGGMICPACGASNLPGATFCDNCGVSLAAPPPVTPPVQPPPVAPPPVGLQPWLEVQASGARLQIPLGQPEVIIGREDPVSGVFPEIDLTPHGGEEAAVSRRHARLTLQGNRCFIEDLNSTNYTYVNKQKLNPGVRQPLSEGDEVWFSKVKTIFHAS